MKQMPECPREDCQFAESMTMTTCAYYSPVYDKNGVNINPDGNTTTFTLTCYKCGKMWNGSTRYGKTTYVELK
jgi:hypothetical protein